MNIAGNVKKHIDSKYVKQNGIKNEQTLENALNLNKSNNNFDIEIAYPKSHGENILFRLVLFHGNFSVSFTTRKSLIACVTRS